MGDKKETWSTTDTMCAAYLLSQGVLLVSIDASSPTKAVFILGIHPDEARTKMCELQSNGIHQYEANRRFLMQLMRDAYRNKKNGQ